MEFNYRNVVEMTLEDILPSGLLDIREGDPDDLIEDVICKTLGDIKPQYIRHHITQAKLAEAGFVLNAHQNQVNTTFYSFINNGRAGLAGLKYDCLYLVVLVLRNLFDMI